MIKFKKKSLLAIAMSVMMAFSICGCGDGKEDESENTEEIQSESDADSDDKDTEEAVITIPGEEVEADEGDDESDEDYEVYIPAEDPSTPEAIAEQEEFDQWLWDSFVESVTSDTVTLHYSIAHPENYDIEVPEVTYGEVDFSEEALAEDKAESEETLAEMEAFDYDLLTGDQKLSYDVIYDYIETDLKIYDNIYLYEPFAYTSGLQTNLPITMAEYTFYDKQDVDDYITLLNLTYDYYNSYLDFERTKSEKGFFMNDTCADEVIRQCEEYIATPEENLLIVTFNDRISEVPDITADEIESYKQANYDAVMNSVIPAYESIISTFNELKGTGTNDLGLCYLEGGNDYYEYLLASKVGTDKTPEDIIEALEERINDVLLDFSSVAFSNYDAYEAYYEDYENFYTDIDAKESIEFFQEAFSDVFPEIPAIEFTVTPVHESLENIVSPAFYMTPPMDDYLNNSIYINEGSETGATWNTYAHEGIPGHMYQFVYFLSNDPEPIRTLLNFNGYQEGWATYVEMMSFEYFDGYEHEAYADFERANNELNLLVSGRIEIGVNYEGWTLEDTQNYLSESGFDPSVAQDIMDYVIAEPANYQMYVSGWLEFEELKEDAIEELGDDFVETDFHRVLLDAGPCQFYILEKLVDDYIHSTN